MQNSAMAPHFTQNKTKVVIACKTTLASPYLYDLLSYSSPCVWWFSHTSLFAFLQTCHCSCPGAFALLPGMLFPQIVTWFTLTSFEFLLKWQHLSEVCPNLPIQNRKPNVLSYPPGFSLQTPYHLLACYSINFLFCLLFIDCSLHAGK